MQFHYALLLVLPSFVLSHLGRWGRVFCPCLLSSILFVPLRTALVFLVLLIFAPATVTCVLLGVLVSSFFYFPLTVLLLVTVVLGCS